jgi:hypothetical protein
LFEGWVLSYGYFHVFIWRLFVLVRQVDAHYLVAAVVLLLTIGSRVVTLMMSSFYLTRLDCRIFCLVVSTLTVSLQGRESLESLESELKTTRRLDRRAGVVLSEVDVDNDDRLVLRKHLRASKELGRRKLQGDDEDMAFLAACIPP